MLGQKAPLEHIDHGLVCIAAGQNPTRQIRHVIAVERMHGFGKLDPALEQQKVVLHGIDIELADRLVDLFDERLCATPTVERRRFGTGHGQKLFDCRCICAQCLFFDRVTGQYGLLCGRRQGGTRLRHEGDL